MKACGKCGAEKPLDEYYAQTRRYDGKHPWCKECCRSYTRGRKDEINERVRNRRLNDSGFVRKRADSTRKWRGSHNEQKREYERKRRLENLDEYRNRVREYASRNPEMTKMLACVRQKVYRAIKKGVLVRPSACEWCGDACKTEAAHADYSKPLDVTWLCRACHAKWDHYDPKYRKWELSAND